MDALQKQKEELQEALEMERQERAAVELTKKDALDHELQSLRQSNEGKSATIQSLQTLLRSRDDYERVHRELDILKRAMSRDEEGEGEEDEPTAEQPLEAILMARNEHLEADLAQLKHALAEVDTMKLEWLDQKSVIQRQQQVIAALEQDVSTLQRTVRPGEKSNQTVHVMDFASV